MSLKKASRTKSLSLSDDFPHRAQSTLRPKTAVTLAKRIEDSGKIFKYMDDNVIGKGVAFLGPFGRRKVVYADYVSSGRSLQFLEDYINKEVLPAYGDMNCTSAVTGLQSQLYNNEARDLVRSAVNATPDDEIVFCDGAYTSPSERLCYLLCYQNENKILNSSYKDADGINVENCDGDKNSSIYGPVLFVSAYEPIQNLKSWIDAGVQIEKINKNREGYLDLVDLEKKLTNYVNSKRRLIGLFSGASRLTGILADDVATTILLHQYGALSLWDYSLAAPYAPININPQLPGAQKDAVFFSTSKFIGGVQAPSILVVKKSLIANSNTSLNDSVGVIGAIRAGLVIQLKESLGIQTIMARQEKMVKQMLSHIRTIPEIVLIGPMSTTAKRLATLCFLVKHPRGAFLHHRFVVAVLNDVFGIQTTAGSHIGRQLGITGKLSVDYERILIDDTLEIESIRPGYTRISLPYFMSDQEMGFILEALKMVATEAWKLLPQYECDDATGEWRHHSNSLAKERKWLGAIRYTDGKMLFTDRRISGPGAFPQNYSDCLHTARNLFNRSRKMAQRTAMSEHIVLRLKNDVAELLRWYMLPGEAHELLLGHSHNVKNIVPFDPHKTTEPLSLLVMHRHNSLSALDIKRFKSRSLPASPVQMAAVSRHLSTPSPTQRNVECVSPPIVRFSLGGEVTTIANFNPPQVTNLMVTDSGVPSRNRCYSWGSALSPQTRINLGLAPQQIPGTNKKRQRVCSCSSQTDLLSVGEYELPSSPSPTPSLQNFLQAGSSFSCEEIQAYVKEVTAELATEIKSEIREVISKVEDVLENNEMSSLNMSSSNNMNSAEEMKKDSVSATDVAEYLKGFSKEMASEVKSEIREAYNTVMEELISYPDTAQSSRKNSPPDIMEKRPPPASRLCIKQQRHSDTTDSRPKSTESTEYDNKQRSESVPRPNSTPGWHRPTAASPESSTPTCPYTGAISKLIDTQGTASHDSGINMYFQEGDDVRSRSTSSVLGDRNRSISNRSDIVESDEIPDIQKPSRRTNSKTTINSDYSHIDEISSPDDATSSTNTPQNKIKKSTATAKLTKRQSSDAESSDNDTGKWHHLPKEVWKQAAEALDEFDMVKDGDKILICISGSSASLCLIHALRQFSRARGLHIEMAACSVGSNGIDPRALMLYLRDLGIDYIFEQQNTTEGVKTKLCSTARRKGYNVIAMGHTLDKLAGDFFTSMLNKGRLHTTQAHSREEDIRIIRPFIYVREHLLEDFSVQKDLPTRPSRTFSKPPDASNSILKVQEIINPAVYENIKSALRPLLSLRLEANKTSYENLRLALVSRD